MYTKPVNKIEDRGKYFQGQLTASGPAHQESHLVKGFYRDIINDHFRRSLWDSGWKSNIIVQDCNVLLAALMKREEGMGGIMYWAIGRGEEDWDDRIPIPDIKTSGLAAEVARKKISPEQIAFINTAGEPHETPTSRIEISSEFNVDDIGSDDPSVIREFGLFGGNATDESGSGFMIDYVIHPRIHLTDGMLLKRKLRLNFEIGTIIQKRKIGFGAKIPVIEISGVGNKYAEELNEHGITNLSDLLEIDPLKPIGNIPMVRLREFNGKARKVSGMSADLANFSALGDYDISSFLRDRPEAIANTISEIGITPQTVFDLQEELTILQIALDDLFLQKTKLSDLMSNQ